MIYWSLRGFVCASWELGGSLAGLNVSFVVMLGASASALRDNRRVSVEAF
jgi:hypothetical protein